MHSAKFNNEQEAENIREAIGRYEIGHPVIVDRNMAIWQSWGKISVYDQAKVASCRFSNKVSKAAPAMIKLQSWK